VGEVELWSEEAASVEAEIRVSGGDEVKEFAALWEWLRGDRALASALRVVQQPPGENELGGVFDVLVVALGSGGAGVALAQALPVWLRSRRSDVTITVTSPTGKVALDAHQVRESAVLPLLQEVLREHHEQ
jgi:hypothetical protein